MSPWFVRHNHDRCVCSSVKLEYLLICSNTCYLTCKNASSYRSVAVKPKNKTLVRLLCHLLEFYWIFREGVLELEETYALSSHTFNWYCFYSFLTFIALCSMSLLMHKNVCVWTMIYCSEFKLCMHWIQYISYNSKWEPKNKTLLVPW